MVFPIEEVLSVSVRVNKDVWDGPEDTGMSEVMVVVRTDNVEFETGVLEALLFSETVGDGEAVED